ncbi:glutathione S-transferase-like protein [Stereum hirsutum FP-91666 SS1]|uniref:glutathione S-transferase-like protein n=1 Tax=Stereum hirsutum (strain FP-91666) TaxID=721885 RepID=UPI000440AF10|nr:glutathione S-transferase-like protein [Stereum hirsutum FP-91666 SS1]EIM90667.1 glutathione S-transferase-like protein [Stereum hirsutum FP-91666 SS1]
MVLKLYGMSLSTCTRRVAAILREKDVPYELVEISLMKGEHKSPAYLEKQPFGQVPYIEDDGLILFESRAIARYVARKYSSQGTPELLPTDLSAYAAFEQAASIEASNFDPFASGIVGEKVFKPMRGLTTNEERVKELYATLEAKLDAYNTILGKQKYLAGDQITLADLFHLPYGFMLGQAGYDIMTQKPNVARWWNDITSRPSWKAVENGA